MSEQATAQEGAPEISAIGVIGAGQMGHGIAQICAQAGYRVCLSDMDEEALKQGLAKIDRGLDRQIERAHISAEDKAATLGRIETSTDLEIFKNCDVVIESVVENEEIKKEILRQLCPLLKPEAIICSNTSSISITRLASITDRPSQFMGMHFMNPVPAMHLIELIRGIATEEPTFQAIKQLALALDKKPATAEDFPAFIVNRILLPMINEAVYTLYEGVGSVEAIDTALKLGAHHPMGPLELADFIGLDTCLAVMHVLYDGLADSKYRPCPLLVKYVEAGWLGKKAGRGFYDYSGETPVPTR
ncbi:MAG: 3-hydroxybutyryl-CoA dehydrogenase [Pseudomonadota bacterium]